MKKEQLKISICFFNDREVRAVWDDERSKWWFSVLDVVGILNEESDYTKTRNYWKYLKAASGPYWMYNGRRLRDIYNETYLREE